MRMRLLTLCAAFLAFAAHADYRNYTDGIQALERSDLARAEALLRGALAQNSEPKERVRLYGSNFQPYLPQYYLGLTLARQKRCPEAMAMLNNAAYRALLPSERVRQVATEDASIRRQCAATGTTVATTAPTPTPGAATAPATSTPAPVPASNSAPAALSASELAAAERAIASLRSLINRPGASAVAALSNRINTAVAGIERARNGKDSPALSRELSAGNALAAQLGRELAQAIAQTAPPPVVPAPPPAATATAPTVAQARTAPALLRQSAIAFYGGDYRGVLTLNAGAVSGIDQGFVRLLQSASALYLFEIGGRKDPAMLKRAASERNEARRLYQKAPSSTFFSPRFIAFWRET